MSSHSRAPKQWLLSKNETLNSFTNWKENLLYTFSLDDNFAPYLVDNVTWAKKSQSNPNRGFTNDPTTVRENRRTAVQKCVQLELMLGQIANYCTVISRNVIVKNSTSLNDIWSKIREHYGFQTTGSRFLDLANIQLNSAERYEDLYQRLLSFFDDNLLTTGTLLTHHGDDITVDEEMTPSMENVVVFLWLQRIHEGLPALIKQRYGAELRNKTLASIKPEISQALDSLLEELKSNNESRIMRLQISQHQRTKYPQQQNRQQQNRRAKICCLCRASNRPGYDTHFISQCKFLPEADKKFMSRVRQIEVDDLDYEIDEDNYDDDDTNHPDTDENSPYIDTPNNSSTSRRVTTRPSPHLKCFYQHYPALVCIDTGAESNLVSEKFAKFVNLNISSTKQGAAQADGHTPLETVGETSFILTKGVHKFQLDALIIRNLSSDIIVGEPFLELNDIGVRSAKKQIIIKGRDIIPYSSSLSSSDNLSSSNRRITICRAPAQNTTIFPGDYIELKVPTTINSDTVVLEPRFDAQSNLSGEWPPVQFTDVIADHIQIKNNSPEPIFLKRNDHFCQIRATTDINLSDINENVLPPKSNIHNTNVTTSYQSVTIDPNNQLSSSLKEKFVHLHQSYNTVFQPIIGRYNDSSGVVRARVNIGKNVPPTRKLKVPTYSNSNLQDLQNKFDDLERQGVFCRPEDIGIAVEHVSPSFLVRKPSGGTRLVTAFTSIGQYSKILPSVMPSVDDTFRTIANWKYIVITDLKDSFYQIPLHKDSIKWCATSTPFRGLRVYTVSAQGMPGSSETLEEMMCTILGHLIQEGVVAKIADDLYVGGNDVETLYSNWSRVVKILSDNGLKLNASKTIIAPTKATILGWIWNNGTITASSHKISPLVSCAPPTTVTALRSYIGAYKVFNRVLRG